MVSRQRRVWRNIWPLLPCALAMACAQGSATSRYRFQLTADRAFFWEVEEPGASKPVAYLLGANGSSDRKLALGPRIKAAFDRSLVLAMSLNMRRPAVNLLSELERHVALPPDVALDDLLSQDTLALLRVRLDEFDVSPKMAELIVQKLRPWYMAVVLWGEPKKLGQFRWERSVGRYFAKRARRRRIEALERPYDMWSAMSTGTAAEHEELLRAILKEKPGVLVREHAEAWMSGDIERMEAHLFLDYGFASYLSATTPPRNRRMAARVEELIRAGEGPIFVVVGVEHLVGEDSIVDLLRHRGFAVERSGRSDRNAVL